MKMTKEKRAYMEDRAELFKALGHSVRLCLLMKLVEDGPSNVTNISTCMDVSQPSISQHLRKLKDWGIVERSKEDNRVFYAVKRKDVRQLVTMISEESAK